MALAWVENTYRAHENGNRGEGGLKEHHVRRYALGFKINETWLATGKGEAVGKPDLELTDEEIRLIQMLRASKNPV